jgi:hypothetical protein
MREAASYLQLANEYEKWQEKEEPWSLRKKLKLDEEEEEEEENNA